MKKLFAVLGALALGASLAVVAASPAASAPAVAVTAPAPTGAEVTGGTSPGAGGGVGTQSLSQCNSLNVEICGWIDHNYSGTFRTFSNTRYVCTNLNSTWNNKMTSVWNYRPLEQIVFWDAANCAPTSDYLIVNPNSGSPNLGYVGSGWNDRASSYMIQWN